jgi:hypothetical protein
MPIQQADALLYELRFSVSELRRTLILTTPHLSEQRRTLSKQRRTLSKQRRTLFKQRRTLFKQRRTLLDLLVFFKAFQTMQLQYLLVQKCWHSCQFLCTVYEHCFTLPPRKCHCVEGC